MRQNRTLFAQQQEEQQVVHSNGPNKAVKASCGDTPHDCLSGF